MVTAISEIRPSGLYSQNEAMKVLGVRSRHTILAYRKNGLLKVSRHKVTGKLGYYGQDLIDFIKGYKCVRR